LCEQEGIRPAPYVGRYKWVLLERLDVLHDEEIEDLIRQSHGMVVPKGKVKRKVRVKAKKAKVKDKSLKHPSTQSRLRTAGRKADS
jgi:hypothetical protein